MTPEQWDRVKEIAAAALQVSPEEREVLVSKLAGDELLLKDEALSLLRYADAPLTDLFDPPSPKISTLVDERYRLEEELGQGGFAITYLASDTRLHGRKVVVKVLKQTRPDDWFERAFDKELRALAQIDHPAVVQPLGAGRLPDGRPYIVEQFVNGRTLRELMAVGTIPLDQIASLISRIGAGLQAAHRQGVHHCDLKPENIMLQQLPDGAEEPRLIDFGIARIRDNPEGWKTTVHVAGTLAYMAPEQLKGRVHDTTDNYALAVICYEMTTGKLPFDAANPVDLSNAQLRPPELASRLRPEVSSRTDSLILDGLASDPNKRPTDAAEYAARLATSLRPSVESSTGEGRRQGNRSWLYASLTVLLLIVGAIIANRGSPFATTPSTDKVSSRPAPIRDNNLSLRIQLQDKESLPVALGGSAYGVAGPFRIEFTSTRDGHLYAFSERASHPEGLNILLPSPTANQGRSDVVAGQLLTAPTESWFVPGPSARQRLWLLWSVSPVPELEAAKKWANEYDRGEIGDPVVRTAIRSLLANSTRAGVELLSGSIELAHDADPVVMQVDFELRPSP